MLFTVSFVGDGHLSMMCNPALHILYNNLPFVNGQDLCNG